MMFDGTHKLGIKTLIFYLVARSIPALFFFAFALFLPTITKFVLTYAGLNIQPSFYPTIAQYGELAMAVLVFCGLLVLVFGVISSLIKYYSTSYALEEFDLKMRHGIISRNEVSIPYEHIEDVNVDQGILFRLIGLGRLVVLSAANAGHDEASTDELFGVIDYGLAVQLREELLKRSSIREVREIKE